MDCIKIKLVNGVYNASCSTVEDWEVVLSAADKVDHVETIKGWEPYTECYKVSVGNDEFLYFVEMLKW